MLTRKIVEELLDALEYALCKASDYAAHLAKAKDDEALMNAQVLLAHEFTGKNAETRAWEATLALRSHEGACLMAESHRKAERDYQATQAAVEVARAAVKLWCALAAQQEKL